MKCIVDLMKGNKNLKWSYVGKTDFEGLKDRIIVIYIDDLTLFSKKWKDHIKDLRQVLHRCKDHGISLNPNKLVFCVIEGMLIDHIVS